MAAKTFHINTEPHVATVGDVTLLFQPEVVGAEFASAYAELREVQKATRGSKASSTKHAKEEDISPETLVSLNKAMRSFLAGFMLPESAEDFEAMRLPDRILVALMEWVAELYGSAGDAEGKTDAPGGQSSGN